MPWTQDLRDLEERFRRRMLALYVVVVATLVVVVSAVQWYNVQREEARDTFRRQITNVCYISRENTINTNAFVDQLIKSVRDSRTLTEEEKRERIAVYSQIRGRVPECPPR